MLMTGFPDWPKVMTTWGNKMLAAVHTVAYMAAIGFGLASEAFTERMAYGPHLLAPTGKLVLLPICYDIVRKGWQLTAIIPAMMCQQRL